MCDLRAPRSIRGRAGRAHITKVTSIGFRLPRNSFFLTGQDRPAPSPMHYSELAARARPLGWLARRGGSGCWPLAAEKTSAATRRPLIGPTAHAARAYYIRNDYCRPNNRGTSSFFVVVTVSLLRISARWWWAVIRVAAYQHLLLS